MSLKRKIKSYISNMLDTDFIKKIVMNFKTNPFLNKIKNKAKIYFSSIREKELDKKIKTYVSNIHEKELDKKVLINIKEDLKKNAKTYVSSIREAELNKKIITNIKKNSYSFLNNLNNNVHICFSKTRTKIKSFKNKKTIVVSTILLLGIITLFPVKPSRPNKDAHNEQRSASSYKNHNTSRKLASIFFKKNSSSNAGEVLSQNICGVEIRFHWCPDGKYTIGGVLNEEGKFLKEHQRTITLSKGFWMQETEVTQEQWQAVMFKNPSKFQAPSRPVENVSWSDCLDFIAKLNNSGNAPSGFKYSLPSQAQWEVACRAGTSTAYFWGDEISNENANCNGFQTQEVGSYPSNPWGLYDMHGNVEEYTSDLYIEFEPSHEDVLLSAQDPIRVGKSEYGIICGGCWKYPCKWCQSSSSQNFIIYPSEGHYENGIAGLRGLRLALVPINKDGMTTEEYKKVQSKIEDAQNFIKNNCFGYALKEIEDALSFSPTGNTLNELREIQGQVVDAIKAQKENAVTIQKSNRKPGELKTIKIRGVEYRFHWCPPGAFYKGICEYSNDNNPCNIKKIPDTSKDLWKLINTQKNSDSDSPLTNVKTIFNFHPLVILTKGFWMQETEVTQKQWNSIMGEARISDVQKVAPNLPAFYCSWYACYNFTKKLNKLSKHQFSMPTSAQFEYACRAGTQTEFYWGKLEDFDANKANVSWNEEIVEDYDLDLPSAPIRHILPVGSYPPNQWKLYDMIGNCQEWCLDNYSRFSDELLIDPDGSNEITGRNIGVTKIIQDLAYYNYLDQEIESDQAPSFPAGFRLVLLDNE